MKNQFEFLIDWMPDVLNAIKKDIKTDHLLSDPAFYRTHFGNRPYNRLSAEEIYAAYQKELIEGNNTSLGEWVVNRWVFKHGEVYNHFAEKLMAIHPDFNEIKDLSPAQSEQILEGAAELFGAIPIFLFSVLNGVVFPEAVIERLRQEAVAERVELKTKRETSEIQQNLEQLIAKHQKEVSKLQEKYESKLVGVQKKYTTDVDALKKQIRTLQQKFTALSK
ncbi:MAG: hypothetical protein V4487_00420 [Chlamydiota bacterium]